jgi:acetylornithine/N-succinyldiaminopimelate aminotransferase
MTAGVHGTTFGGNPLAMAMGNAVLDVLLEPGFLPHVVAAAEKLRHGLAKIVADNPAVYAEVRGQGLLTGLRCVVPNGEVQTRLREQGLLTVAAGDNVVRLLPPLTIGDAEIQEALAAIKAVASAWVVQA